MSTIKPTSCNESSHGINEKIREKIVRFVFLIYLLLILEGAIRKWLMPGLGEFIFFIRVPVTLWLYLFVWRRGVWPRPYKFLVFGLSIAIVGLLLIPFQMIVGGYSAQHLILAGYGWINYFFYIPLVFIIAEHLHLSDLQRLIKITLLLAIIATPLAVLQLFSPANSSIVQGFGTGPMNQFVGLGFGYANKARPMGFFTSSVGQQMFISSTLCFVIAVWIVPTFRKNISALLRYGSTIAVMILIGVSLQRGALVHAGIVLVFTLLGGVLAFRRSMFLKSVIYPFVFVVLGLTIVTVWFPSAYEMFMVRLGFMESSYIMPTSLGLFDRIIHELTRFVLIIEHVPITGYLLGMGGNASSQLSWVDLPEIWTSWDGSHGFAEDGLSRNIVELGPVIGFIFIYYRYSFFLSLFNKALFMARNGSPFPMMLIGFLGPLLLTMQMTGHGTIIGYAWMFIGFTMVSIREAKSHNLEKLTAKKIT